MNEHEHEDRVQNIMELVKFKRIAEIQLATSESEEAKKEYEEAIKTFHALIIAEMDMIGRIV
jgi:hypothetical protein